MSDKQASKPSPRLSGLPDARPRTHIVPTAGHRAMAEAFLREEPIDAEMRALIDELVAGFGWAEQNYIRSARQNGEQTRVWDTTKWIVANALAACGRASSRQPLNGRQKH